jgi:hypothetical protein
MTLATAAPSWRTSVNQITLAVKAIPTKPLITVALQISPSSRVEHIAARKHEMEHHADCVGHDAGDAAPAGPGVNIGLIFVAYHVASWLWRRGFSFAHATAST